jgi:hypothetical protein
MNDVLLLHDNAWPHTSLRTGEAVAKMVWTVLPRPAHSPDLARSDYHVFGPVKDEVRGSHFADDSEWNKVFVMRSEVEAGIQHLTYSVLHNVGKSVLKMMENL